MQGELFGTNSGMFEIRNARTWDALLEARLVLWKFARSPDQWSIDLEVICDAQSVQDFSMLKIEDPASTELCVVIRNEDMSTALGHGCWMVSVSMDPSALLTMHFRCREMEIY